VGNWINSIYLEFWEFLGIILGIPEFLGFFWEFFGYFWGFLGNP
jgi:hypothetical protein